MLPREKKIDWTYQEILSVVQWEGLHIVGKPGHWDVQQFDTQEALMLISRLVEEIENIII